MTSRLPELNATSYAALGQLALRPWTVYDMTKNITRTLRWFWPRAESVIYREVKQLERRGLARRTDVPGRRGKPAARYAITAAGTRALRAWLASPSGGWTYHSEPLLRLHLSPYGSKSDLVQALQAARQQGNELVETAIVVGTEFAQGRHQFQDQVHIRAMLFDHLWNLGTSTVAWADACLEQLEQWEDLEITPARQAAAEQAIAARLDQHVRGTGAVTDVVGSA